MYILGNSKPPCTSLTTPSLHAHPWLLQASMHIHDYSKPPYTSFTTPSLHVHPWLLQASMHILDYSKPPCISMSTPSLHPHPWLLQASIYILDYSKPPCTSMTTPSLHAHPCLLQASMHIQDYSKPLCTSMTTPNLYAHPWLLQASMHILNYSKPPCTSKTTPSLHAPMTTPILDPVKQTGEKRYLSLKTNMLKLAYLLGWQFISDYNWVYKACSVLCLVCGLPSLWKFLPNPKKATVVWLVKFSCATLTSSWPYMGIGNNNNKTWHVCSVQCCVHGYCQQYMMCDMFIVQ